MFMVNDVKKEVVDVIRKVFECLCYIIDNCDVELFILVMVEAMIDYEKIDECV